MKDDYKTFEGLNKTIEELHKKNEELWQYKERCIDLEKLCQGLKRQIEIKRNVVRVIGRKGEFLYAQMITRIDDTPEGMFIEIQLPTEVQKVIEEGKV